MEIVTLNRFQDDNKQTLGEMLYKGKVICKTLELSWKQNQNRISCIPTGKYKVVRRFSEKFKDHFHILKVDRRAYILIHNANYYYDLLGCIGVGQTHQDINKDGYTDVTNSVNTMKKLLKALPLEFTLHII